MFDEVVELPLPATASATVYCQSSTPALLRVREVDESAATVGRRNDVHTPRREARIVNVTPQHVPHSTCSEASFTLYCHIVFLSAALSTAHQVGLVSLPLPLSAHSLRMSSATRWAPKGGSGAATISSNSSTQQQSRQAPADAAPQTELQPAPSSSLPPLSGSPVCGSGSVQADVVSAACELSGVAIRQQQVRDARWQHEEDRRRREEEERQKAVKAMAAKAEDDKRMYDERTALRVSNAAAHRDELTVRLDSSIKRCSSLLRKLRALSDQPIAALLSDLSQVNMGKYSSELIGAVLDTTLRRREDIEKVVRVCSVMHQRHEHFNKQLMDAIEQRFFADVRGRSAGGSRRGISSSSSGGVSGASESVSVKEEDGEEGEKRRRGMLRLLVELLYVGLTDDARLVLDIVADAMQKDRNDTSQTLTALQGGPSTFANLALLLSFLRYAGEEFASLTPRRQLTAVSTDLTPHPQPQPHSSPPLLLCVPSDIRDKAHSLFQQYWALACKRYEAVTVELQRREKRLLRMEVMRKDITEEQRKERKQLRDNWDRLQTHMAQVAELMDQQLPVVEEKADNMDETTDSSTALVSLINNSADDKDGASGAATSAPFDDEESKVFYSQLLDLTLVVPPMLLKDDDDDDDRDEEVGKEAKSEKERKDAADKQQQPQQDKQAAEAVDKRVSRRKRRRGGEDNDDGNSDDLSIEQLEKRLAAIQETKQQQQEEEEAADDDQPLSSSQPLDALFSQLRSAYSADAIDQIATKFAYLNSRSNRTRLLSHLIHLPRSALSLLPFAARLCGILNQYHRDVGELLVSALLDDFFRLLSRSDKDKKLDYKVRNIRFLAELCKFGVCSSGVIFKCWKACLLSLAASSSDTVHVIAAMLETCGSFLYRQPATHPRCVALIEETRKLKEPGGPLHNDRSLAAVLEAALDSCQPDTAAGRPARQQRKERHPLELYTRKLIFADLNPRCVERITIRLRKLPWTAQTQQQQPTTNTATAAIATELPAVPVTPTATASSNTPTPTPLTPAEMSANSSISTFAVSAALPSPTLPPPLSTPPAPHIPSVILKCLRSAHLVSYSSLSSLASLSSSLNTYHPSLGVPLIDSVLEEIRSGLESNSFTQQQHRVTFVRYLAALFLCHMCDVQVVIDTLYMLIWFGQQQPQQQPAGDVTPQPHSASFPWQSTVGGDNRLDPPYDSFRLRLIVALLDGVAVFFTSSSKSAQSAQCHLRRYLLYLVRYVKMKEFVAFDVDQQLADVMDKLGHSALKLLTWSELQAHITDMEHTQQTQDESAERTVRNDKPQAAGSGAISGPVTSLSAEERSGEQTENRLERAADEMDGEGEENSVDDAVLESDVQPEDLQAAADEAAAESKVQDDEYEDAEAGDEVDGEEDEECDEEADGEGSDDDEEDEEEEEEEEEEDVWNRRRRTALSSEDASFERDLERLMADSIEQRRSDPRTQAMAPVESLLMAHGLQQSRQRAAAASVAVAAVRTNRQSEDEEVVVFKLLTRDKAVRSGGDSLVQRERGVRELYVPVDSDMAVSSLANSKEMEEERRNVKRLVLAGLEREEREVQERERARMEADRWTDKRKQQQPHNDRAAAYEATPDDEWNAAGDRTDRDRGSGRGRHRERGQAGTKQAWEERSDSQQQQQYRRSGGSAGGGGQQRSVSSSASSSSTPSSSISTFSILSAPGGGGRVGMVSLPSTRPVTVALSAQPTRTSAAIARSKADKNRGPRLDSHLTLLDMLQK